MPHLNLVREWLDEQQIAIMDWPAQSPHLLSLRRDYHRAATRAVMAGHHLEFLNAASVPQGLQLTLRPQVYAADTSSVDSEISEILTTAQSNIISALSKHYSSLQATSTNKKQTVLAEMSSLLSPSSSLSPTEIEEHKAIMKKTENNPRKKIATLADRARRKLERPPQDKMHTGFSYHRPPATHTVPRERQTATIKQLSLTMPPHDTSPSSPTVTPPKHSTSPAYSLLSEASPSPPRSPLITLTTPTPTPPSSPVTPYFLLSEASPSPPRPPLITLTTHTSSSCYEASPSPPTTTTHINHLPHLPPPSPTLSTPPSPTPSTPLSTPFALEISQKVQPSGKAIDAFLHESGDLFKGRSRGDIYSQSKKPD